MIPPEARTALIFRSLWFHEEQIFHYNIFISGEERFLAAHDHNRAPGGILPSVSPGGLHIWTPCAHTKKQPISVYYMHSLSLVVHIINESLGEIRGSWI
jgi:hypothetical protein